MESRKSTKIVEIAGECFCFQQPSLKNLAFSVFLATGAAEMEGTPKQKLEPGNGGKKPLQIHENDFAGDSFSSSHP